MRVRAQMAMVMNLDKCIGCHTCSVVCKNVWTNRNGVEYAWFNNVESKPGVGFPQQWENQEIWNGGWEKKNGELRLKSGGRLKRLASLFANPDMPEVEDYGLPVTYDYAHLQTDQLMEATPTARPRSLIDGAQVEKLKWGSNWEDDLGGEFIKRSRDVNFGGIQKQMYGEFENTFAMYLPRICNHCLNPSCVASCPSGSIYKREEDGIVLVDQDKCRGWRMCVTACPYKKIYYNWESGKAEKCILCYPRVESGMPTLCAETCVGRIRYMGVILYDADRISEAAGTDDEKDLYAEHQKIFLDPNDPEVIKQARKDGVPESWIEGAQNSPVYKMAIEWGVAFPLHPEFRTLPMVWYVPPLSPVQSQLDQGNLATEEDGMIPKADAMRMPLRFLANLLSAGNEQVIHQGLNRLLALRSYQRSMRVEGTKDLRLLERVGLTEAQIDEMYRYMAIANYEDRFVIPTAQDETRQEDPYAFQGYNGFNASQDSGVSDFGLFPKQRANSVFVDLPKRRSE